MRPSSPRSSKDLLDDRAVLALQLARALRRRALSSGRSSTSTRSSPSAARLRRADQRAVLARDGDRAAAAGQTDLLGDLGDRADL